MTLGWCVVTAMWAGFTLTLRGLCSVFIAVCDHIHLCGQCASVCRYVAVGKVAHSLSVLVIFAERVQRNAGCGAFAT